MIQKDLKDGFTVFRRKNTNLWYPISAIPYKSKDFFVLRPNITNNLFLTFFVKGEPNLTIEITSDLELNKVINGICLDYNDPLDF